MVGNTVSLFREASEHLDGHLATIIFGGAVVVTAMMAVPLAKKCDRKTLLGISALGVTACLFSLGAFYYLKIHYENDVKQFGWVALVDFLIYTGFFMVSTLTQCLKMTKKVSFNIASKVTYVYILNEQKFIKKAKNGPVWRVFENLKLAVKQWYQTGQF